MKKMKTAKDFSWHKAAENIIYLKKIISHSASGIYIFRDTRMLEKSSYCWAGEMFNAER